MAKMCVFCGKIIGVMSQYTRVINGKGYEMCPDCAFSYDRFKLKRPNIHEETLPWYERVIVDPNVAAELKTDLTEHRKSMLVSGISSGEKSTAGATSTSPTSYGSQGSGYSGYQSGGSMWIGVLKTIGILSIVVETIAGMLIGVGMAYEGGFFLGGFLGLFIGIVSASMLMTFAGMAEDVKATRDITEREATHLAEIAKLLKK